MLKNVFIQWKTYSVAKNILYIFYSVDKTFLTSAFNYFWPKKRNTKTKPSIQKHFLNPKQF